jgi:hypothetical protein
MMNLTRVLLCALALAVCGTWSVAQAADEAPAGETKTTKKSKTEKKGDGTTQETKTETKTEKK